MIGAGFSKVAKACQFVLLTKSRLPAVCKEGIRTYFKFRIGNNMMIKTIPALSDNYMYLLNCKIQVMDMQTKEAAVVDPVEPAKVLKEVRKEGGNLTKVLTTHHHWDHSGGNEDLAKQTKVQIYGGDKRVGGITHIVKEGDTIDLGRLKIKCISTPCHTSSHICYFVTGPDQKPAVFTGDTLFIAGCGRFFEGTPAQMYSALVEKLGKLPDETQVFCGHEYTTANLKFAKTLEPNNQDVINKLTWSESQRNKNLPTVPSTIGEEKQYNPFMRVTQKSLLDKYGSSDPVSVMGIIRVAKDKFKA
ncbi:hydroxyacylglutathione hydrolase, mitochondrial-like isoform X2 [Cimex lectularius]|uniref:hydroxyacylglutathione hydrolase n=1 Tax=Cimex lectularius TaxID=79782 RepID=A0A8I6TMK6_CIMLE|nr:hydroxyacylglutathione hydrolase, mitochondrial-like isoform X2 [Cimex lectularius]